VAAATPRVKRRKRNTALTTANLLCKLTQLTNNLCTESRSPASAPALLILDGQWDPPFREKLKLVTISILAALIVAPACSLVHKRVETEKLLTPLASANTSDLISAVNKLVTVKSIHGRVDIQFEDTSFATSGIAEKYRTVDGSIYLQRPGKIYLTIQAPVVASDIAQMTSDGEHFRIAILKGDEKYRRFVTGTNNADYAKLDMDGNSSPADKKGKDNSERKLSTRFQICGRSI